MAAPDGAHATEVHYHASGPAPEGVLQQNAGWECAWTATEPPLLRGIRVLHHDDFGAIDEPRNRRAHAGPLRLEAAVTEGPVRRRVHDRHCAANERCGLSHSWRLA